MKNTEDKSKLIENLELRSAYKDFNNNILSLINLTLSSLAVEAKGAVISLQKSYDHLRRKHISCL